MKYKIFQYVIYCISSCNRVKCFFSLTQANSSCYRHAVARGILLEAWVFCKNSPCQESFLKGWGNTCKTVTVYQRFTETGGSDSDLLETKDLEVSALPWISPFTPLFLPFLHTQIIWTWGALKMNLRNYGELLSSQWLPSQSINVSLLQTLIH